MEQLNSNNALFRNPTKAEILFAREWANLTPEAAGELLYDTERTWEEWESGGSLMHPQLFEAFLLKTGQLQYGNYELLLALRQGRENGPRQDSCYAPELP